MLDSLTLLRAMNGIHEEDVVMAGNIYMNGKSTHRRGRRLLTLALAAALVLALGVAAYSTVLGLGRQHGDSIRADGGRH